MISHKNERSITKIAIVRQLLLFYKYLLAYIDGMIEYVNYNEITETRLDISIGQLIGIIEEIVELGKAIYSLNYREILVEFCDIWHSIVIFIFMCFSPRLLWCTKPFWLAIAFLSALYPIKKHASRYLEHGCIRNHKHCLRKDHTCIVNSKARV